MATSPVRLPSSNTAGNNQTGPPGLQGANKPAAIPFSSTGGGSNPLIPAAGTGSGGFPTATPQNQQFGTSPSGAGSLYDPSSSYSNGQSNIDKQLVDIYGKGVGGMLDNLLKGMSGEDSAIFQQWLKSMQPVEASERASLQGSLGAGGVSANSSVNAIASSNLESQFNAQAAGVNSQLMQQQMQDTLDVLMGVRGDAAKEVSSSGWGVLAEVMNNITGDVGNLMGGSYKSGGSNYQNIGSTDNGAAPQLGSNVNMPNAAPGGQFGADWSGNAPGDNIDTSIFNSEPVGPDGATFMF